jgi:L-lactate permease
MPVKMASITAIYGACYGLFPIGWIILNVIFLYRMTLVTIMLQWSNRADKNPAEVLHTKTA